MDTFPSYVLDDVTPSDAVGEVPKSIQAQPMTQVNYGDLHDMYYPDVVPSAPEKEQVIKKGFIARVFRRNK